MDYQPDEHSEVAKCELSSKPVCRRMFNINLALGYVEEVYCLTELAGMHGQSTAEMFDFGYSYVQSRECFTKEWAKMTNPASCPLREECEFTKCFQGE
jgi:hypothetical protein